jgi:hypothetical protein
MQNNNSYTPLKIKNTSMAVFDESQKYINGKRMFYSYHEKFPSYIYFRNISTEKAIKWVESDLKDQILHKALSIVVHYLRITKTELINAIFMFSQ